MLDVAVGFKSRSMFTQFLTLIISSWLNGGLADARIKIVTFIKLILEEWFSWVEILR